jgi:hypothetical protein
LAKDIVVVFLFGTEYALGGGKFTFTLKVSLLECPIENDLQLLVEGKS